MAIEYADVYKIQELIREVENALENLGFEVESMKRKING